MSTMLYNYKSSSYSNETLVMERANYGKGNWVLKDKTTDKQIDTDKYRNDLAERHNLKLGSMSETAQAAKNQLH